MQLKDRLKAVCDFVEPGGSVADIGTDHAYLPIYLIEQKVAEKALACDVHEGPYLAAKQAVKSAGLEDKIAVRLGDGLKAVSPREVQTAVIAGMGGATMIGILSGSPEVTTSLQRLVLQPMNAAKELRLYLIATGWRIAGENLVVDEGRLYEIICAERGAAEHIEDVLAEIGPRLWEKRHPLLTRHIESLITKQEGILLGMATSAQARSTEKYSLTQEKKAELEAKLACL